MFSRVWPQPTLGSCSAPPQGTTPSSPPCSGNHGGAWLVIYSRFPRLMLFSENIPSYSFSRSGIVTKIAVIIFFSRSEKIPKEFEGNGFCF